MILTSTGKDYAPASQSSPEKQPQTAGQPTKGSVGLLAILFQTNNQNYDCPLCFSKASRLSNQSVAVFFRKKSNMPFGSEVPGLSSASA